MCWCCKPGSSLLVLNKAVCFLFYRCIEITGLSRFLKKDRRENTLSAVRAQLTLHQQTQTNLTPSFPSRHGLWSRSVCYLFLTACSVFGEKPKTHMVLYFKDKRHCPPANGCAHGQRTNWARGSLWTWSINRLISATTKQTPGSSIELFNEN